jgi:3'-phosphoadenosine 5'-phosphosulfate sulfotransferase (PAPS reductase)/FAD synthetase
VIEWHVVSFSGGKDSTAMLLRMLEIGMRVDEIIFCDTGVEFPQMYEHVYKVERYIGRQITRLKAPNSFEFMLLDYEIHARNGNIKRGYGFADMRNRWCTSYFKRDMIKRHLRGRENVIQYVGIAADESHRAKEKRYPLIEWGWTEKDALQYCYDKGFDWGGLYKIFGRVSCWCCPLKNLNELRKLRKHFPGLWATLKEWDAKTWRKFRADYSVDELDARFAREEDAKKMQICLF